MRLPPELRVAGLAGAAVAVLYGVSALSRMSTWGTNEAEASGDMPGDELVPLARYRSTHAITIGATPAEVWPWLVQMGQGRGGLYSYDWLENALGLQIHSADRVEPALQDLGVGDVVRLVPEHTRPELRFTVARLDAPSVLVLGPDRDRAAAFAAHLPSPCWTFQLRSAGAGAGPTRLVVRFQMDFKPSPWTSFAYGYALAPVHFMMERKMMLGIRRRAEDSVRPGPRVQPDELAA